ncbi:efflux RND transporter periplasmic adaptor subunit [Aliiglaciecola sp. LCG003]|uniref:efflux RND transporter periplasmic adaptor subunit n=1 Tax=Aliiglaciecola sp. LCG003 TaxID=3053655 RepID=UPI0025725671|nr:efflux RND transporter periplasmic adaptor subunit [Aliiglaciecola sp. LCG003]WJG10992.1 efflux RND transporter periplasmic adaptor subunit [Aliiglaciecola sp. LCG003]
MRRYSKNKTTANLQLSSLMVLLSCYLLAFESRAQQVEDEPTPALVEVDKVRAEMIAQHIWVPGSVLSRTDSDIASEVPGRITWLAEVGDMLEAGDIIAKVDDHMLQLNYQQNVANIAKWQARVTLLERKLQRYNTMVMQANTAKDQLDEVVSELEIAQQEFNQAKIDKKLTEYRLAQSNIKSPFKAMVVERLQSPGEYIAVGQRLARIVDIDNIEASIKAPLSSVPYISQGLEVVVKVGDRQSNQTIRSIVPVGDQSSRMMEIRVALKSGDYAIGEAVRVALPNSEYHHGLTVPRDALVLRKSGAYVYQVDSNLTARQIAVETGVGVGDRIEVTGLLNGHQPVVIRGAERLREGQKVRYQDKAKDVAKL